MPRTYTPKEVVLSLVGSVKPIGETNEDDRRFENLKVLCDLVGSLVDEIYAVSYRNQDASESSGKRAADYAFHFLTTTLGMISE